MGEWDAIIIGAGPSGLCTGALLSKAGKKVLILEKQHLTGGRRQCGMINGVLLEDGPFGPSRAGYMEDIFSRIGKPYPAGRNMQKSEINRDGEWGPLLEGADRQALRNIMSEVNSYSYDEIEKFDGVSLKDWVLERTKDEGLHKLFFAISAGVQPADRLEDLSAGEALMHYKQHLERWGHITKTVLLIKGGSPALLNPLIESIEENGGEIRTGVAVNDIIVENGKACGVEIEVGEKLIHTHIRDIEFIKAPIVICSVPFWDIFKVISEDIFPEWYVDWIKRISHQFCYLIGFTMGMKHLVWDFHIMRWYLPGLPRTKMALAAYYETPTVLQIYCQPQWHDAPYLSDLSKAKNRRKTREFLKLLEEDIYEVLPDLKESIEWKVANTGIFSIADAPGMEASSRPGIVTPIENLYLVGNNIREARGLAYQGLAHSAILCADEILGKN